MQGRARGKPRPECLGDIGVAGPAARADLVGYTTNEETSLAPSRMLSQSPRGNES